MGSSTVKIKGADATANSNGVKALLQAMVGPGRAFFITVTNTGGVAQWVFFNDKAAAPAVNGSPTIPVAIPAGATVNIDFGLGRPITNGIFVGNSLSATQYQVGAADCIFDVLYTAGIGQV